MKFYLVYDYNPRIKQFYVTCRTTCAETAAAWFRFHNPENADNWKYIQVVTK
jgi:hypothetical protein